MEPNLYKLNHLIAVVEEGSFTRAAARLHLSQQALSTSIRALEREVGVQLLDRAGNNLQVLPAGEALVADARVLRGVARSAVQRARRIGRGEPELLRIGHTPAVTSYEITTLLRRITPHQPDLAMQINQRYPHELIEQLLAGELELGLCRAMPPAQGLNRTLMTHQRLRVAVDADHHLAANIRVKLAELHGETFIVWGQPGKSGYTDLLIEYCLSAGFEPDIERNPIQGTPPATAVVGTDHLAFVTDPPGPTANSRARVVELDPPCYAPLHALWSPHTTSISRDHLLATASS